MKKFYLFFLAAVLSMSMFAEGETGQTKGQAIPYDWSTGIHVSSEAGVGKWYVVKLKKEDGGPFHADKTDLSTYGKTDEGLTNINVMVVNPLDEEATIDVVAYIGDNETSRHFKLGPGGFKAMTFGAGMFIQMGIDRVYLYLVMDVTVTEEQAAQAEAVNVNVTPVESENVVSFVPDTFNWQGWPEKTVATVIPANKETWVKIDFTKHSGLAEGSTYKFYAEKADGSKITVDAGLSYDCPATSIQEQSAELKSASTAKILDAAKLDITPDVIYLRLKAPQELRLSAEEVLIPAPDPEDPVLFEKKDAKEVELYDGTAAKIYSLNNGQLAYKVAYNTLKAEPNYYRQIEVTNHEDHEITIVGKATKTFIDGKAYSAVSKSVTIPAGQTYTKKIDKTMQSAVGVDEHDTIWAVGPAYNVTFKLTQLPNDPEYCQSATTFVWDEWNQQNGGYKWYAVNIAAAKADKADIMLTMETINQNEEANITIDLASYCQLGAPVQSYTGKSKSRTKTLSYSLYENNENDEMYVRVRTDKPIKVKAEKITAVIYDPAIYSELGYNGWSAVPVKEKIARIEKPLVIENGTTIEALGVTLAAGDEDTNITIENGGKLFVGEEGVKGSLSSNQIVVEEGGMLLVDPWCPEIRVPYVTVQKRLELGAQLNYETYGDFAATLPDLHEFIAVPVENHAKIENLRYLNWHLYNGWEYQYKDFSTFTGYNVFLRSSDAVYEPIDATFKGKLADHSKQKFDASEWGWHAYGNSWLAPIKLSRMFEWMQNRSSDDNREKAIHTYVANPTLFPGLDHVIKDNYYLVMTEEIAGEIGKTEIAPMQGFFVYAGENHSWSMEIEYTDVWNDATGYGPSNVKAAERTVDNRNKAAVVLYDGNNSDFVYMIEGDATSATKMVNSNLAIYAEDRMGQIASDNLIGTTLTIKTSNASEYTLSFGWLNGETLVLQDMETGAIINMTAGNKYTFTATPNTTSARFQVIGRKNMPTGMENTDSIKGANKRIENGKVVIIKNGVKYNVLGAQL